MLFSLRVLVFLTGFTFFYLPYPTHAGVDPVRSKTPNPVTASSNGAEATATLLAWTSNGVDVSLWKTEKSQHAIIYYQEAPSGYVERLINEAEKYYNSILEDLGYRRFEFWSWDNRAKIYLYKDASNYHTDTQRASWSGAMVNIKKRTIKTFIGQAGFFDSILPHEMTHIIFREFIGEKENLPLWLDEGIAGSQEKSNLNERMKVARNLVSLDIYLDVNKLSEIRDSTLVVPQIFYAQSASLVVFLLEQYGRDKFLEFSRRLRDGTNWQEALISVYRFADLNDMQEKWKEFMVPKY